MPLGRLSRVNAEAIDLRPIDLLDPGQDVDARAWIAVHHAARREAMREDGGTWTLAELRAFHRDGQKLRVVRGAWLDDELVGALEVVMPLLDNQGLATVWLSVAPEAGRRDVGSALYAEGERIAREHCRTILFTQTRWRVGGVDESEGFAHRHGFEVAMTDLRGSMDLGDPERLRAIVQAGAGDDYALESYVDDMPAEWLADRAILQQRMITDMPLGDLMLEEEHWDAERLRAENARWRQAGRRLVETVARDQPSGRLVGFTQVSVAGEEPTLGHQEDTLVLSEHRGHRLGLRLKAANALLLSDVMPAVTTIRTWNAEDNAPMLTVNRTLGYVVDGYARQWQKILA
jgi:GNAT superfamily N-acetyltransferase